MKHKAIWMGWIVLLQLASAQIFAQTKALTQFAPGVDDVRFERFSTEHGLSQPNVRAITQDRLGFIWLGTRDGLNRFDGQAIRVFRHDRRAADSISDSIVSALAADRDDEGIWVGSRFGGLDYFDPKTERFLHQNIDALAPLSAQYQEIVSLFVDGRNRLWIARADGGFLLRDPNAKKVVGAPHWVQKRNHVVRSIRERGDGELLLATSSGLFLYQPDQGLVRQIELPTHESQDVSQLAVAANGGVWVGLSSGGVLKLKSNFGFDFALNSNASEELLRLDNDEIRGLEIDQSGALWIASNLGLARYDGSQHTMRRWRADRADEDALPTDRISCAFLTREGNLWFGTSYEGAVSHVPSSVSFIEIRAESRAPNALPQSAVSALWQDTDGSFWFGILDGGGLVHFDLQKGVLQRFVHNPDDTASLSHNRVRSILRDDHNDLWVATAKGLNRLSASAKGFTHYFSDSADPTTLPSDRLEDLFVDSQGNVWVTTADAGVAMRCRTCESFKRYEVWEESESEMKYLAAAITEMRDGRFWVSLSNGGVTILDPETGRIQRLRNDSNDPSSIGFDTVAGVLEDSRGGIWVATHGAGLSYATGNTAGKAPKFVSINREHGLDSDVVAGVLEDVLGNIWVATANGLNRIDPLSKQITRFGIGDGVFPSGYFVNALNRGPGGSLMFGSPLGITLVTDPVLKSSSSPVPPIITEVQVGNEAAFNFNGQSYLDAPAAYAKKLRVPANRGYFSLRLASLGYPAPENLRFGYRLEGANNEWIETQLGSGLVSVNGLPTGTYQLEYRVSGPDGRWIAAESPLQIEMLAPKWRSAPAKLLYLFSALVILIWFLRMWQVRQLELSKIAEQDRLARERLTLAVDVSGAELWDFDSVRGVIKRDNALPYYATSNSEGNSTMEDFKRALLPEDVAGFLDRLRKHLKGETEVFEAEFRAKSPDGGIRWLFSRGRVVERDANNRALRMLGTTQDVTLLKEREESLRLLNEGLERRVTERTSELSRSNQELTRAIEELHNAQQHLVESEKLASLGSLVAGVAHEINTPLGVGVTAASHLQTEAAKVSKKSSEGTLTEGESGRFAKVAAQSADIILKNLQRADKLVKSFKQVAVDQGNEDKRKILLADYLDEVVTSLNPALRKSHHQVNLVCDKAIEIESYPGAIYQVIANLVMNAHVHAFENRAQGIITIEASEVVGNRIEIAVRDDGIGMNEAVRKRIFEPFYTTKRGRGGSGLGLHIVYNLVTQLLRGAIYCESEPDVGTSFRVVLPKILA